MSASDTMTLLRERLAALRPIALDIRDDSALHIGHAGSAGGAGHFALTIVAESFRHQSRLARHRQVLDALRDLIPARVHAVAIQALAPDEAV